MSDGVVMSGDILADTDEMAKSDAERAREYRARKRGGAPRELRPHGTTAAAQRHMRNDEPLCDLCAEAWREFNRANYEKRKAAHKVLPDPDDLPAVDVDALAAGIRARRTCKPDCGHDAYDADCSEYAARKCCGYVVHVDDLDDNSGLDHLDDCPLSLMNQDKAAEAVEVELTPSGFAALDMPGTPSPLKITRAEAVRLADYLDGLDPKPRGAVGAAKALRRAAK